MNDQFTKCSITLPTGQVLKGTFADLHTGFECKRTLWRERYQVGPIMIIVKRYGKLGSLKRFTSVEVNAAGPGHNWSNFLELSHRSYNWWLSQERMGHAIVHALNMAQKDLNREAARKLKEIQYLSDAIERCEY